MLPTFNNTQSVSANYRQKFTLAGIRFFNDTQLADIGSLMENYTAEFAPDSIGRVISEFVFQDQKHSLPTLTVAPQTVAPQNRLLRSSQAARNNGNIPLWQRVLQEENFENTLTYSMVYQSETINVTAYPANFQFFINQNLDRLTDDMNNLSISVVVSEEAFQINTQTAEPTSSSMPSVTPTMAPTTSASPTDVPSAAPSSFPSNMASEPPSESPSGPPTDEPTTPTASSNTSMIIIVIVAVVAILVLILLFVFYRKRKRLQEQQQPSISEKRRVSGSHYRDHSQGGIDGSWNAAVGKSGPPKPLNALDPISHYSPDGRVSLGHEGLISPSESLVSNQSLLSAGNSMGGDSGDEADATQQLQDEFEQYKDKNLEKMREEVEGSVTGFDGMMSQALTKALMDDDEINVEPSELLWGGEGHQSGSEVEASALCEVTDWLKRNDNAPIDGK